ncbi:hypothetical protein FRB99_004826, partial [Tulasnella sp. 403]
WNQGRRNVIQPNFVPKSTASGPRETIQLVEWKGVRSRSATYVVKKVLLPADRKARVVLTM